MDLCVSNWNGDSGTVHCTLAVATPTSTPTRKWCSASDYKSNLSATWWTVIYKTNSKQCITPITATSSINSKYIHRVSVTQLFLYSMYALGNIIFLLSQHFSFFSSNKARTKSPYVVRHYVHMDISQHLWHSTFTLLSAVCYGYCILTFWSQKRGKSGGL